MDRMVKRRRGGRLEAPCLAWLLWAGFSVLPSSASAQVVAGRVVDAQRATVIAGAAVRAVVGDDRPLAYAVSDADGRFELSLPVADVPMRLEIEASLYRPAVIDSLRVGPDEVLTVPDIRLEAAPVELDGLTAEVERPRLTPGREWVRQHQLLGRGQFFPGALLAQAAGPSLAYYLSSETDLWMRIDARGRRSLINPRGFSRCMAVLVNRWPLGRTGFRTIDDIPLDHIAAIELYESERDLPPGYVFDAPGRCGIVNIWLWNSW